MLIYVLYLLGFSGRYTTYDVETIVKLSSHMPEDIALHLLRDVKFPRRGTEI